MRAWTETVRQFSDAIREGATFTPGEIICPRYPEERGVGVYRNNYRGNLHDTLAGAYPVIRKLVGEDFFRLLARRFMEAHPSRSGNLHRYGSEMAEFLTHFANVQHLVYLPDMARLEWAYHRAYFADDVPPFDLTRLAGVTPRSYAVMRWEFHPACMLIASAFPVTAIWQAHQEDAPGDFNIDLNAGGETLLVYRNASGVEIARIAPDCRCWLEQLQQGTAMQMATDITLSAFPGFDLAAALRHWLAQGVLIDFDIAMEQA